MWVRGLKLKMVKKYLRLTASHPMWVRGLKRCTKSTEHNRNCVAPYVGAWIETLHSIYSLIKFGSHPMWVRGLKLIPHTHIRHATLSHPMWVRGLKL